MPATKSPPFAFLATWPYLRIDNFVRLFDDELFIRAFLTSIQNAGLATFLCLVIGYPMALCLTRIGRRWRNILLMLIILPFWTSFLLRIYAWIGLMGTNSWFNKGLTAVVNSFMPAAWAIPSIQMMNTNFAVILVMVYTYLPFMILPLYANLERLDTTLNEAALDLGSRPWEVFKDVTLPLSIPGIISGGLLVFIPTSGELIIPSLVGNAADPMLGSVIRDQFSSAVDWPMASAVAVGLLLLLVFPMMAYNYFEAKAHLRRDGLQ
ncbi:ABC transporter permease [Hyphomicrobium sp. MC1]|uniref:ABC transporter permease n=1 Tax=Hyphomicrobium sp. (strain MC1) TaxID=717785 RepID=UPI0018D2C4D7|nr:ABC transporter permease [Hyphomicrobium sp. MC1]